MANSAVENYTTELITIPADVDFIDVTVLVSTGPNVYDSQKMQYSVVKGMAVVASKLAQDFGFGSTGNIYTLDWHCTGKKVYSAIIELRVVTAGKAPTAIFAVGSSSGGDEIMLSQIANNMIVGNTYKFFLNGTIPEMLSDSDDYFVEVTGEPTSTLTCDIFVHALHQDV